MLFQFRQKNTPGSLQVLRWLPRYHTKSDNSLRKQHDFCWHLPYFNPSGWFIGVPCHPFETSFVRPSNPIHYVLLDSVWPCFIPCFATSNHFCLVTCTCPFQSRSGKFGPTEQEPSLQGDQVLSCGQAFRLRSQQKYWALLDINTIVWAKILENGVPLSARRTIFMVLTILGAIEVNNQVFYHGWELLRATFLFLDSWTHVILSRDVPALPNPMAEGFSRPE